MHTIHKHTCGCRGCHAAADRGPQREDSVHCRDFAAYPAWKVQVKRLQAFGETKLGQGALTPRYLHLTSMLLLLA